MISKLNRIHAWKNDGNRIFVPKSAGGYLRPVQAVAGACGASCGAGDEEKPEDKPSACGSSCGAGE